MQRKVEKLKRKLNNLEDVEQLNMDLQQEILNLTKSQNKAQSQSQSKPVNSSSLKSIAQHINPELSDDEVNIYLILYI